MLRPNAEFWRSLADVLTHYGVPVAETQAQLAAALVAAALAASLAVTSQIASTETHLAGYKSAANGVPSTDTDETAFVGLATAVGLSASVLATVVAPAAISIAGINA